MTPPRESQRPEKNTVRIATVTSIPKVLNQLGYDPVPLLAELGLELSLFDDTDNVIPDYPAEFLFAIDMRLDLFDECLATKVHVVT